ncbi:protein asteroid homolog 1 isoform X2 [Haplochromis burtoni]|uniref:protein asteroid homolog 1 isoform X2 n=1 Tax=Haplochromis burtoni TaxID=8153 RepID=UPI001C2D93C6|nr:protein asteroid homolog 1 isoform X2 [Haplochromis burtoni]
MEVSKLKKMIDDLCLYEEVNIEKTGLIIDGAALYYSLYYTSDPKLDRRCGGDYPGFKDEAPEGLRRRVFEEALQVQTSALENIPDQLKLPVCVTVFWFNNLKLGQKAETVHCLHALLLWFVCDPNSPEDEFERKMKTLKDEGVNNWQPQHHVAKAFIQWQCCMRQSLHLNQLLCSPLPEPQCAR